MGRHNSLIPLYEEILTKMCSDLQQQFPDLSKDLARSFRNILNRSVNEGLPFLTKRLPDLGKALLVGLELGFFKPPIGFKLKPSSSITLLLSELILLIFDSDGVLLGTPSASAISALRQVCATWYKMRLPYSDNEIMAVADNFVSTEEELHATRVLPSGLLDHARTLVYDLFRSFDPKEIRPRNGPGVVADGLSSSERFSIPPRETGTMYPYVEYFTLGYDHLFARLVEWGPGGPSRYSDRHSKAIFVPKDARGPRMISAEPSWNMWLQQGLGRKMMSHCESSSLTRRHVNFTDQGVNQALTRKCSLDGTFATIDLKDASDRVSLKVVEELFPPLLFEAINCLRSTHTLLHTPCGSELISLSKHAPMGSALCFPVEAIVFWAICVSVLMHRGWSRHEALTRVYVYGDDIIVPTTEVEYVIMGLESFGFVVNRSKSFWRGRFRESCGVECFDGFDVAPTYLRSSWSDQGPRSVNEFCSYVSFAWQLAKKGFIFASDAVFNAIERKYGLLPYVLDDRIPGRPAANFQQVIHMNNSRLKTRWNLSLQRREWKILLPKAKSTRSKLDGWDGILAAILQDIDTDRVALRGDAYLTRSWNPL